MHPKMNMNQELIVHNPMREKMGSKKILTTVILLVLTVFPNCTSLKSVPDELIGTWTTEAQEYCKSSLELDQKTIQFCKKDGTVDNYSIIKIKRQRLKGAWVRYTIFYRDHKLKKYEFPILYNPYKNGIVRFLNKDQNTWIRESL